MWANCTSASESMSYTMSFPTRRKYPAISLTFNKFNMYLNMNTRDKNHGIHLGKRHFTYNIELILHDIMSKYK